MIATRLLFSIVPAWLVTFGLFHLMQSLISVEAAMRPETASTSWVEIVKVMISRRTETPEPRAIRRVAHVSPPPPLPSLPTTPARVVDQDGFAVRDGASDGGGRDVFRDDELAPPSLDGEAVPLVRVEPRYPAQAMRQGREGRVLVEFTIGRTGSVEAARVVAAEPPGLFDREAIEAVKQWKYNPRIDRGRAVPQPGLRTTISFRLDRARS